MLADDKQMLSEVVVRANCQTVVRDRDNNTRETGNRRVTRSHVLIHVHRRERGGGPIQLSESSLQEVDLLTLFLLIIL